MKEEAAQEQKDLTERRARKATTCQRKRGKRRHGGCRNVENLMSQMQLNMKRSVQLESRIRDMDGGDAQHS